MFYVDDAISALMADPLEHPAVGGALNSDSDAGLSAPVPRLRSVMVCPVCGSADRRHRFSSEDLLCDVPGTFDYVECGVCRTVYQDPSVTPEDLALCYPPAYFTHSAPLDADADEGRDSVRAWLRELVLESLARPHEQSLTRRLVGRALAAIPFVRKRACYGLIDGLAPGANGYRCLEVGPGRGQDLRRLRLLGWDAFGVDVDPVAAASATRFSGCEVRSGVVAEVDFPQSWFGLIYMSHSLEHLPDLVASLRRCHELLQQGGRVVLVYPNPGALTARWYGPRSPIWDPPRHLVLPPVDAIAELLARIGFVGIKVKSIARYARGYRSVAKEYAAGRRGCGFMPGSPAFGDTVFAFAERFLTGVGVQVGEEIVAVAYKDTV